MGGHPTASRDAATTQHTLALRNLSSPRPSSTDRKLTTKPSNRVKVLRLVGVLCLLVVIERDPLEIAAAAPVALSLLLLSFRTENNLLHPVARHVRRRDDAQPP